MNNYKLCFWISVAAWAVSVIFFLTVPVSSQDYVPTEAELVIPVLDNEAICAAIDSVNVDKPAAEPVTYEDWFRANANRIDECTITHYCREKRRHICGTGDGITSTGVEVTPYWTCAVDPSVIPYGAEVMVDYGDRIEFWKAQDTGGWIEGNHIDLAVSAHEEAISLGVKIADVYWMEVNNE